MDIAITPRPSLLEIVAAACDLHDVTIEEVRSRRRMPPILRAREDIAYCARLWSIHTCGEIASMINKRRTTVCEITARMDRLTHDDLCTRIAQMRDRIHAKRQQ